MKSGFVIVILAATLALAQAGIRARSEPGSPSASAEPPSASAPPEPGKVSADPPASILLITLDTTRADHLGCYGYFRPTSPNLDALARESVVFDRACAPMASTFPSHLSLLTGVFPSEHGYLSNTRLIDAAFEPTEKLQSVAQLLKAQGYATAAFVSAAPVRDTTGLAAGFDVFNQPDKDDWKTEGTRSAEQTSAAFQSWLAGRRREPFFAWIHYFDPHWPYQAPAPFDASFKTDDALRQWVAQRGCTQRFPDKWKGRDVLEIHNAYDGELRYMDEQIGRVVRALRDDDWLDRCVVVVAGDHGEGLGQHQWPAHGDLHEEQIHVPLMMRFPRASGAAPARISAVVSLVDVFPTVLPRIGLPAAASAFQKQATGEDVLDPRFSRRFVFSERTDHSEGWPSGRRFALTDARYRYYHLTEHDDELYDLSADPHELRNILPDQPQVAGMMRRELLARLTGYRSRGQALAQERTTTSHPPDERMKRDLKALGYVETEDEEKTSQPAKPPADAPRP